MKLSDVLQAIVEFGQANLKGKALEYLTTERRVTRELIEEFELGYYPFGVTPPVDPQWLQYHRLICRDTDERTRCPFEGRILFPVRNTYGELVSIQARIIDDHLDPTLERYNQRKYYHNSFDKSRVLYNLHRVIPIVRRTGKLLVTEGQLDVIAAYKFGIRNIICTTGTVLNRKHMSILCRYVEELLVIFDNDDAGRKAMEKLQRREYVGLQTRFIILPSDNDKNDLDMFLHAHGKEALVKLVKRADGVADRISSLNQL